MDTLVLLYSGFCFLFTGAYIWMMRSYIIYWQKLPRWTLPDDFFPNTSISVIIPARNEEDTIISCLNSILQQDYPTPLLEIIVIDDHSTDRTALLVKELQHPQIKLIALSDFVDEQKTHSFKKKALEIAIAQAKGELILSTDADCILPSQWLVLFASYYEYYQPKFIAAPVNFYDEQNTLERFQSLDFMGMMGITGAGIKGQFMNMCNGANLAYPKAVFEELNGFEGVDTLASGDDMFFMQKVAHKYPHQIGFLKNRAATVLTKAKPDWASFFQQRIRWASKSSSYQEWKVPMMLGAVFLFCATIFLNTLLVFFFPMLIIILFIQLLVKAIMDYTLLSQMSAFFQRKDLMNYFIRSFFYHLFYIVAIGLIANVKKEYVWKDRKTS